MKSLKLSKKIVSLAMIFVLIGVLIPVTKVNATENVTSKEYVKPVEVKSTDSSYNEGLAVFGISREEAEREGYKLYSLGTSLNYFQPFTCNGSSNGAYWKVTGSSIRWGFVWNGTNGNSTNLYLKVGLYMYPANDSNLVSQGLANNGNSYSSGWITTHTGMDYKFKYDCYYSGGSLGSATVTSWVLMT